MDIKTKIKGVPKWAKKNPCIIGLTGILIGVIANTIYHDKKYGDIWLEADFDDGGKRYTVTSPKIREMEKLEGEMKMKYIYLNELK